jgi:hypothetical protein
MLDKCEIAAKIKAFDDWCLVEWYRLSPQAHSARQGVGRYADPGVITKSGLNEKLIELGFPSLFPELNFPLAEDRDLIGLLEKVSKLMQEILPGISEPQQKKLLKCNQTITLLIRIFSEEG